ncbi:MAG: FxsA family protein [Pseudobdellovibrionaceae bacterium]
MFFIPFPFVIAEIVIFVLSVEHFGFLNTIGFYILPSLFGFLIVSTVGRMAISTLQSTVTRGQLPTGRILNSAAIFISGLLFLIPSFFTRLLGLILFLPGLRHLVVWYFKNNMSKKMAAGGKGFNFGAGSFGFGTGSSGFRYYEYKSGNMDFGPATEERDVTEANVLDVTPLAVTHEDKSNSKKD